MHECLSYHAMDLVSLFNYLMHQYNSTQAGAELVVFMFSSFDSAYEKIFQQSVHQYLVQFRRRKMKLGKIFAVPCQQLFQCLSPVSKMTPFRFDQRALIFSLFLDPKKSEIKRFSGLFVMKVQESKGSRLFLFHCLSWKRNKKGLHKQDAKQGPSLTPCLVSRRANMKCWDPRTRVFSCGVSVGVSEKRQ